MLFNYLGKFQGLADKKWFVITYKLYHEVAWYEECPVLLSDNTYILKIRLETLLELILNYSMKNSPSYSCLVHDLKDLQIYKSTWETIEKCF